jgi:hypothetical protein
MSMVQRREFADYRPLHHRALTWLRRKLSRSAPQTVYVDTATATATAGGDLSLEVSRAPQTTPEGRITRLEEEMEDLRRKQREDHAALEGRVVEAHDRIERTESGLRTALAEVEAKRKEGLRESLTFQKAGIGLFIGGVVLSVLGNLV